MIKLELRKCKMENFDKNIIVLGLILVSTFYLFYRSLFNTKKLTTFQQHNRRQLINKQGVILAFILAFSYGYDYVLKNYLYQFFMNLFQLQISQNTFVLYGFGLVAVLVFLLNLKLNSYIKSKDERVVNIEQEATFANFKPVKREVKPIIFYSHYFNGISLERSPKDYTIQNVKLNINLSDIQKFKTAQEQKELKINDFYRRLIDYINSKSKIFEYQKIEEYEIQNCKNMFELKILIYNRFNNLTKKQYFASVSQLFQIANSDETEFLAFLRDSQHFKFSSISIKHAVLFLKMGVIK